MGLYDYSAAPKAQGKNSDSQSVFTSSFGDFSSGQDSLLRFFRGNRAMLFAILLGLQLLFSLANIITVFRTSVFTKPFEILNLVSILPDLFGFAISVLFPLGVLYLVVGGKKINMYLMRNGTYFIRLSLQISAVFLGLASLFLAIMIVGSIFVNIGSALIMGLILGGVIYVVFKFLLEGLDFVRLLSRNLSSKRIDDSVPLPRAERLRPYLVAGIIVQILSLILLLLAADMLGSSFSELLEFNSTIDYLAYFLSMFILVYSISLCNYFDQRVKKKYLENTSTWRMPPRM